MDVVLDAEVDGDFSNDSISLNYDAVGDGEKSLPDSVVVTFRVDFLIELQGAALAGVAEGRISGTYEAHSSVRDDYGCSAEASATATFTGSFSAVVVDASEQDATGGLPKCVSYAFVR